MFFFFKDFPENRRSGKGTNIWQFLGVVKFQGSIHGLRPPLSLTENVKSAVDFFLNKWGQPSMRAGLKLSKLKSQVNSIWETQKAKAKFQRLIASWWILWESNLAFLLSISGCKRWENSCQDDPNNCQLDWFTPTGMVNLISKHPFTLWRANFFANIRFKVYFREPLHN